MVIFNIANCTMNLQKEQESFSKFILYVSLFLYFFFSHWYEIYMGNIVDNYVILLYVDIITRFIPLTLKCTEIFLLLFCIVIFYFFNFILFLNFTKLY